MKTIITAIVVFISVSVWSQSFEVVSAVEGDVLKIKIIPEDYSVLLSILNNGLSVTVANGGNKDVLFSSRKPRIFSAKSSENFNSMDYFIKNIVESKKKVSADSDITLGFYLLESIKSPEHNAASGLYFELDNKDFKGFDIEISSGNFAETVRVEASVLEIRPSELFMDIVQDKNQIQVNWKHNEKIAWLYRLEEINNGDWESLSPFVPFRDNTSLKYSFLMKDNSKKALRLFGLNSFGEKVIIQSGMIIETGDHTPPNEVYDIGAVVDSISLNLQNSTIYLSWKYEEVKDVDKVLIYSSIRGDSAFSLVKEIVGKEMLSGKTTMLEKQNKRWVYYKVVCRDKAGNENQGTIIYKGLPDFIAPPTPTNIVATIDTLGVVSILWDESIVSDLHGYLVEASPSKSGPFQQLHMLMPTTNYTVDTLEMNLDKNKYFYRVAAVDNSMNISKYSEMVFVQIIDTIRPQSPGFYKVKVDSDIHILEWKNGYDTDVDKILICHSTDQKSWDTIYMNSLGITSFEMKDRISGSHLYTMLTQDKSGNLSNGNITIEVAQFEKDNVVEISFLEVKQEGEYATLIWDDEDSNMQYMVFLESAKGRAEVVESFSNSPGKVLLSSNNDSVTFYIQAQDANGVLHPKSDSVTLKL